MAEGGQGDEGSKKPGFGMRLCLSTLRKQFPKVPNISTDTLSKWLKESRTPREQTETETQEQKKKLLVLDCRPQEEYYISHLDGAVRVDFDKDAKDIVEGVPQLYSPDITDVVCYCSLGFRSSVVVKKLHNYRKEKGDTDSKLSQNVSLYNLEGSLFKWANEQRPIVDNDGKPTIFVHPFSVVFGKLLNSEYRKWK